MVDRSDLVVFWVLCESGGAWQTMQYARKMKKRFVNLYALMEETR